MLRQAIGGDFIDVRLRMIFAQIPIPGARAERQQTLSDRPPALCGTGIVAPFPMDVRYQIRGVSKPGGSFAGAVKKSNALSLSPRARWTQPR